MTRNSNHSRLALIIVVAGLTACGNTGGRQTGVRIAGVSRQTVNRTKIPSAAPVRNKARPKAPILEPDPAWISPGRTNPFTFLDTNNGFYILPPRTGGRIFRTNDGGTSWTPLNIVDGIKELAFIDTKTGVAVGAKGLYRTVDAGDSWTLTTPTPDPSKLVFQRVYATSIGSFYALDSAGTLYNSQDGGATWRTRPLQGQTLAVCASGNQLVALSVGGTVSTSTDEGTTWAKSPLVVALSSGEAELKCRHDDIAVHVSSPAAGHRDEFIAVSPTFAATWILVSQPNSIQPTEIADRVVGAVVGIAPDGETLVATRCSAQCNDGERPWHLSPILGGKIGKQVFTPSAPDEFANETTAIYEDSQVLDDGTIWYSDLVQPSQGGPKFPYLRLFRSLDGGLTWTLQWRDLTDMFSSTLPAGYVHG